MKSVYIMKAGNFYKIGVSANPKKRLQALRIGNPDIKLICESKLLQNAYAIESALHKKYHNFALGREWFSIRDENKLIDDAYTIIDEIGIFNQSEKPKSETGRDENNIPAIFELLFEPEEKVIEELYREIDEINKENIFLMKRLIELGWTQEEIDLLVKEAENSVEG